MSRLYIQQVVDVTKRSVDMTKRSVAAITRFYYWALDVIQKRVVKAVALWHRFRKTEVGEAIVWLWPRFWKMMWFILKVELAMVVVVYGVLFFFLLILTGNGKAAIKSIEKVSLVVIGFFATKKLVTHKSEIAEAIKAVAAVKVAAAP